MSTIPRTGALAKSSRAIESDALGRGKHTCEVSDGSTHDEHAPIDQKEFDSSPRPQERRTTPTRGVGKSDRGRSRERATAAEWRAPPPLTRQRAQDRLRQEVRPA